MKEIGVLMSQDQTKQWLVKGLLKQVTGGNIKDYMHVDFGRQKKPGVQSVLIAEDKSLSFLVKVRQKLPQGFAAFLGTDQWLGDDRFDGVELIVVETRDQLDFLRWAESDGINYDLDTEDIIAKLQSYHDQFGINILQAATDTVVFRLLALPDDLMAFAHDLYEFCPDIVDQGCGSVAKLADIVDRTQKVFLWWD